MTESNRNLGKVITIDDGRIQDHLSRVITGNVEDTLNSMLEAEADALCNAKRYERTEARTDTRAGHYERGWKTRDGKVSLKVPKLRRLKFETAIIERYQRRESSVEEALMEMYLAFPSAGSRILLRHYGVRGSAPVQSATSTRRYMRK